MAILEPDNTTERISLAELYQKNAVWLRAAVRIRGGADRTEDVVQEAFARFVPYARRVPVRHPKALLLKIVDNLLRTTARQAASAGRTCDVPLDEIDGWVSSLPDQFEAIVLKQAILALPEIYREVFMLSRFDGMSYQEIAEARGLSVKTVEWRMSKALAMCAARMRE